MKNIPKICHFCWTKGSPMSLLQAISVLSFIKYNPDWEVWVHLSKQTSDELGKNTYVPDYVGKDYFYIVEELSHIQIKEVDLESLGIGKDKHGILVSDILRIFMLYHYGGVYSDFDMLWLQPMRAFANINCIGNSRDFETTVCYYQQTKGHHNASNIVSEPGGNYLLSILEEQKQIRPPYTHQAFNSELLNKKFPTYDIIQDKHPRVIAIDYATFYPYSIYGLNRLYLETDLSCMNKRVMGVHWFNGHDLSRDYVDNGLFTRPCSMTQILIDEGWTDVEFA